MHQITPTLYEKLIYPVVCYLIVQCNKSIYDKVFFAFLFPRLYGHNLILSLFPTIGCYFSNPLKNWLKRKDIIMLRLCTLKPKTFSIFSAQMLANTN